MSELVDTLNSSVLTHKQSRGLFITAILKHGPKSISKLHFLLTLPNPLALAWCPQSLLCCFVLCVSIARSVPNCGFSSGYNSDIP